MGAVTTAMIAALAPGAKSAPSDVAKKVTADGYEALKALRKRKFSAEYDVLAAVEELESKPDSDGRQVMAKRGEVRLTDLDHPRAALHYQAISNQLPAEEEPLRAIYLSSASPFPTRRRKPVIHMRVCAVAN